MSMTSVSGGIYAVKKVHAAFHCLQNICRCTDSHQIGRFVHGQVGNCLFQNMIHFLMGLTDCKTADRITVQIQVCNPFGMLYSDIRVNCTLVNAEQKLLLIDRIVQAVQASHLFFAAFQPSCRPVYGRLHVASLRFCRRTLIECHCNGRCEV